MPNVCGCKGYDLTGELPQNDAAAGGTRVPSVSGFLNLKKKPREPTVDTRDVHHAVADKPRHFFLTEKGPNLPAL